MRKIDLTNFQVATSETARQINRRITLNFLRHNQPMSRADLSRRSGLQRSTVSAIVDQLITEGWVTEGAIGRLPRGRRPRFLHLNVERTGIVGVNLRPETTTVGLANVDARFEAQRSFPTPSDPAGICPRRRSHDREPADRASAHGVRGRRREPARPRRRGRTARVRTESRLAGRGSATDARNGDRAASERGERGECVRARRALVRPAR